MQSICNIQTNVLLPVLTFKVDVKDKGKYCKDHNINIMNK